MRSISLASGEDIKVAIDEPYPQGALGWGGINVGFHKIGLEFWGWVAFPGSK